MSIYSYENSNKRLVLKKHIRNNKTQVKKAKNMHKHYNTFHLGELSQNPFFSFVLHFISQ